MVSPVLQGTPAVVVCGPPVVKCRCFFFKGLSYFINKRYFVISTLCHSFPRAAGCSYSSPTYSRLGKGQLPSPPPGVVSWCPPSCLPVCFIHAASPIPHCEPVGVEWPEEPEEGGGVLWAGTWGKTPTGKTSGQGNRTCKKGAMCVW